MRVHLANLIEIDKPLLLLLTQYFYFVMLTTITVFNGWKTLHSCNGKQGLRWGSEEATFSDMPDKETWIF